MRQAMLAGMALSIFLTTLITLQSPPESRLTSLVLTAGSCAVVVTLVLLSVRAVQARQKR